MISVTAVLAPPVVSDVSEKYILSTLICCALVAVTLWNITATGVGHTHLDFSIGNLCPSDLKSVAFLEYKVALEFESISLTLSQVQKL